jgi:hypothetical protein
LRFAQPRIKGAKPGDLARNPTKFDLMINLQTGKALGIAIPPTLLSSRSLAILMSSLSEHVRPTLTAICCPY